MHCGCCFRHRPIWRPFTDASSCHRLCAGASSPLPWPSIARHRLPYVQFGLRRCVSSKVTAPAGSRPSPTAFEALEAVLAMLQAPPSEPPSSPLRDKAAVIVAETNNIIASSNGRGS